ncbi:hypothetical protein [Prevotella sp. OH937_COT-195]|uniref:hypothetical protein n=1 Tax=Prevotella sp. OH937_COT-195 TaxID=2491051 RepID=UPI000F650DF4|nr:hypothetical protein [Prevotella sp. OH937_COT-195]RRD02766.1 hypothetical protein EII32_01800 [Prevotella sp. OH937_COT-195]
MNELKVGDIVILNSEEDIKLTVTALLINGRLEATYWNIPKGEFQTVVGGINAFKKVSGES